MGLDQVAYTKDESTGKTEEIMSWRKHNRLQGYMENLYYQKGGEEEIFNCIPIQLGLSDIDELEEVIENRNLPETEGFFFGGDSYDGYEEYYKENDLTFIKGARSLLEKGEAVYYDSWW